MIRLAAFALVLLTIPAFAQQADPIFLQKAINSLSGQRNVAMDQAAAFEAKAAMLTEEVAALKKQIEELKSKTPEQK